MVDSLSGDQYNKIYAVTDVMLHKYHQYFNNMSITKEDIFYYCFEILNSPNHIQEYNAELARDLLKNSFYQNVSRFLYI